MQINENIAAHLDDVSTRISCASDNAHIIFSWISECSNSNIGGYELDALYSTIAHLDELCKELDGVVADIWKKPDTATEQTDRQTKEPKTPDWIASEKANQKKNGYEPETA